MKFYNIAQQNVAQNKIKLLPHMLVVMLSLLFITSQVGIPFVVHFCKRAASDERANCACSKVQHVPKKSSESCCKQSWILKKLHNVFEVTPKKSVQHFTFSSLQSETHLTHALSLITFKVLATSRFLQTLASDQSHYSLIIKNSCWLI